jgi:zinc transport system permease protein
LVKQLLFIPTTMITIITYMAKFWMVIITSMGSLVIMTDFLLYAFLAGIGVASVAGPLGCFVVWRRMAYFGDTLAHSALLGVSLGVMLDVNLNLTVTAIPLIMAMVLVFLEQRGFLSLDTLLGILSHSALALGLVVISLLPDVRVDLMSLLFGDLLAVTQSDLWVIYGVACAVMILLGLLWQQLINITVDPELAAVEGTNVTLVSTALMLITALVIALAMKVVGVLLITALLIIPAATAQRLSHTPEQMAMMASVIAMVAVVMGLAMSWYIDTPAGPSVVISAGVLFSLSLGYRRLAS